MLADAIRVLARRLSDPQKPYSNHELEVLLSLTIVLRENRQKNPGTDQKIAAGDR
jgi:hypothetical protein